MFVLLALFACVETPAPDPDGFGISPADGQTGVGVDLPLRVHGDWHYPDGHPVPDVIRVSRLGEGGFLAGRIAIDGEVLSFWPDGGWAADTAYVWSVQEPAPTTRTPELDVPEQRLGSAVFHTSRSLEALGAVWQEEGRLCVLLSRPPDGSDLTRIALTVDGEPASFTSLEVLPPSQFDMEVLPEGDEGLGAVCGTVRGATPSAWVRVWIGEQPWVYELDDTELLDVARAARRL